MHNCIFTSHCTELTCDKSCPILAETAYLLERNHIYDTTHVFSLSQTKIDEFTQILEKSDGKLYTYVCNDTTLDSASITYVAICNNWRNSQLHCTVYNLRYSTYLDELKRSWNTHSESESLEYMRIWSQSAKVLIISHFDYVNFGDFESQTLLLLLQERQAKNKTTIVISPKIDSLVCTKSSVFFVSLRNKLLSSSERAVIV